MDIHQTGIRGMTVSPHLLEQHLTREHLPRLPRKCHQEIEFERGEGDLLVAAADLVRGDVDRDLTDGEHLCGFLLGTTQPRPHTCDEFLRLERLDDVVVGARLEAEDDIDGVRLRSEHDDRHARIRPEHPAHVDPVHAGQHQIEQDEIGAELAHGARAWVPSPTTKVRTFTTQDDREHLCECRIVVDNQNPRLHNLYRVTPRPL